MRFLKADGHGEPSLTKNLSKDIPNYAILSHTWATDEEDEVTLNDLKDGSGQGKRGYAKIRFCGEQAWKDGLQHFWVDTCCIDKTSHTELAEAIASMFRWYQQAKNCYVYLSDVSVSIEGNAHPTEETWKSEFRKSRWFTRGWTLQELLAPRSVEFFSREGTWLGNKTTLEQHLHDITGIPIMALRGVAVSNFSVAERMRWAAKRETTKPEDKAYCLLGIFDVFMPPIYGEGEHAFVRLQDEIDRRSGRGVDVDKLSSAQGMNSTRHVPFDRLSAFVGRIDEMNRLKRQIFDPTSYGIISILGLGGVGKSRLVLELIQQLKVEYPSRSVFWIEATNQLSFERDMLEIGKKLAIPGVTDDKADIKTLVKHWLSNVLKGGWLLILDNADDEALWGNRSNLTNRKPTLVDWLPSSTTGSILITTRSRRVASHLAGKEVIQLSTMPLEDARKMFTNALERPEMAADDDATSALLNMLTCLPLAIVQAASYINMTQEPVKTYLELLHEPEEEVVKLLSEDFGDRSRYSSVHNAVALTWLVSFNQIRQYHPIAARLLGFMACLHEKNIPRSLLPDISSKKDALEAFATLNGYSFVTKQTKDKGETSDEMFDMHRLVHLAARNWLRKEGMLSDLTEACITRLADLFPTRAHENRGIWTAYLPHAQRLCDESGVKDLATRYRLLEKMGLCFVMDGKYAEAVKTQTAVVRWKENKLGTFHEQTLFSYNILGEASIWSGDFPTAEMYLTKALQKQKEILTAEHPHTLASTANLASTYRHQGRWKEAEELDRQVMETMKRVLGAEHPDTLASINNLASTYRDQGRWKEAEELDVQVMETRKRVLGAEHPDTLTSTANLASTYWNQGRLKEAEELDRQVMEMRKRVLGAEHPWTLTSTANLASTYWNQGRWKEAEELDRQVMETRKRVLGAEHPWTLTSTANLASTYRNQGRLKEAEELDVQVMETKKRVLGAEHPDTLASINNLASTYLGQGRWKEAEELFIQARETMKRVLGAEHPWTLTCIANLAAIASSR